MIKNILILGTGTDVGKTIASSIIVEALQADYWKPIQCGELENSDTMKVKSLISNNLTHFHEEVYKLEAPQSPHYAADLENTKIELFNIKILKTENPYLVIETAGGICVPLNEKDFIIDLFPKDTPIILVSKHELGSINHTLLSINYLKTNHFNNISVLFIGEEKPSTEKVILNREKVFSLGRIPILPSLSKEHILEQAQCLKPQLHQFLHEKS